MTPIAELEEAVNAARSAIASMAERIEHAPGLRAVEGYVRASALLFGRLLVVELRHRLQEGVPTTEEEAVLLIEAALSAAWEAFRPGLPLVTVAG